MWVFFFSVGFIFFKGVGRGWNVFLWLMLIMGNGMLMCLYSLEWYARQRCPENMVRNLSTFKCSIFAFFNVKYCTYQFCIQTRCFIIVVCVGATFKSSKMWYTLVRVNQMFLNMYVNVPNRVNLNQVFIGTK